MINKILFEIANFICGLVGIGLSVLTVYVMTSGMLTPFWSAVLLLVALTVGFYGPVYLRHKFNIKEIVYRYTDEEIIQIMNSGRMTKRQVLEIIRQIGKAEYDRLMK